jgi:sugar O-acyltransferase (sialic acid O-acetyltransferase NeuD family)
MFGQSQFFGDYVDLIHALGGRLSRVVLNADEVTQPRRKTFAERLREYHAFLQQIGIQRQVDVVRIEEFETRDGEAYVYGFRNPAGLARLRDSLWDGHRIRFSTLVHPAAYVSPTTVLGEGVVVLHGAQVASFCRVEDLVLINKGAVVGHDVRIGIQAEIGPGVALASGTIVGPRARVGIGASVIENLVLGEDCMVAAGAAVIQDVEPKTLVAGVPAVVKKRIGG